MSQPAVSIPAVPAEKEKLDAPPREGGLVLVLPAPKPNPDEDELGGRDREEEEVIAGAVPKPNPDEEEEEVSGGRAGEAVLAPKLKPELVPEAAGLLLPAAAPKEKPVDVGAVAGLEVLLVPKPNPADGVDVAAGDAPPNPNPEEVPAGVFELKAEAEPKENPDVVPGAAVELAPKENPVDGADAAGVLAPKPKLVGAGLIDAAGAWLFEFVEPKEKPDDAGAVPALVPNPKPPALGAVEFVVPPPNEKPGVPLANGVV